MRKGKTRTGFECEFDERILDDMRFLDLLADLVGDELTEIEAVVKTSNLVSMLLGKDNKKALYDHIAKLHDGYVPSTVVMEETFDIMKADGDIKN